MIAGTADKAEFSPEVQQALFGQSDRLAEFVKGLSPIQKFSFSGSRTEGDVIIRTYDIEYKEMTLVLMVGRDKANRVVAFGLNPA